MIQQKIQPAPSDDSIRFAMETAAAWVAEFDRQKDLLNGLSANSTHRDRVETYVDMLDGDIATVARQVDLTGDALAAMIRSGRKAPSRKAMAANADALAEAERRLAEANSEEAEAIREATAAQQRVIAARKTRRQAERSRDAIATGEVR